MVGYTEGESESLGITLSEKVGYAHTRQKIAGMPLAAPGTPTRGASLTPPDQARPLAVRFAEQRTRLLERFGTRTSPDEAVFYLKETLDTLRTADINERNTVERRVVERALMVLHDALQGLQATEPISSYPQLPESHPGQLALARVGRLLGLQMAVSVGLLVLLLTLSQRLQEPLLVLASALTIGLWVVQGLVIYRLLARGPKTDLPALPKPDVAVRVDGEKLLSSVNHAVMAIDQLVASVPPPPSLAPTDPHQPNDGLAASPAVLEVLQSLCGAALNQNAPRALQRAEFLLETLASAGIEVRVHEGTSEPPPHLFELQRSQSAEGAAMKTILPAFIWHGQVLLRGRVEVPANQEVARG
jgi:hypothetical protein